MQPVHAAGIRAGDLAGGGQARHRHVDIAAIDAIALSLAVGASGKIRSLASYSAP